MFFHYFVIISPWKRAEPSISTNLNPHPHNFVNDFFLLFPYHLHLENGMALHFYKFECPSPKNALFPSLVEFNCAVLEKKTKMWKVYRQTDEQTTDNPWSESSLNLSAHWAKNACDLTLSCLFISGTILFKWIWSEVENIKRQQTFIIQFLVWSDVKALCR